MYKRGNAHTIPVELSESNASSVNTSIEIHIFVIISYNQGIIYVAVAPAANDQRSSHNGVIMASILHLNCCSTMKQDLKFKELNLV